MNFVGKFLLDKFVVQYILRNFAPRKKAVDNKKTVV